MIAKCEYTYARYWMRLILIILFFGYGHNSAATQTITDVARLSKAQPFSFDWISPHLERERQSAEAALLLPFTDEFQVSIKTPRGLAKRTLHNCLEYLSIEKSITDRGPATTANILRKIGSRCDGLDFLAHARPATHPCFDDFTFNKITAKRLSPMLALLVSRDDRRAAEKLTRQGMSITALEDKIVFHPLSQEHATLQVPQRWTSDLTVLAHADFLGNGKEELLLESEAAVIDGSFRSTHIYLLGCPDQSKILPVITQR